MQSESIPELMQQASYQEFWCGVLAANPPHQGGTEIVGGATAGIRDKG